MILDFILADDQDCERIDTWCERHPLICFAFIMVAAFLVMAAGD